MRRHHLDHTDIRTLAAGSLTPELVQRLRAAELSKHLILLEAVRRKAVATTDSRERAAIDADGFERALAALERLERISPDLARKVLRLPQLGAWACRCLTGPSSGRPVDLGYLARLAEPAGDGAARGVPISIRCGDIAFEVVLDHSDPWLDLYGPRVSGPPEKKAWRDRLAAGLRSIARHDRDLAAAIATGLHTIVPLQASAGGRPRSATSGWAFGAIALSYPPSDRWCAESLVHEFRHLVLSALSDHFPLMRSAGGPLGYAPWRDDPRPASSLLFGAHAYVGLLDFWRRQGGWAAAEQCARWLSPTIDVVEDLASSGTLTREGSLVVAAMRERLSGWRIRPGRSAAHRLAEDAATDHRLRWRLRHLRPDDRALDALADAWAAGRRPVDVPTRLVEDATRETAPGAGPQTLEPAQDGYARWPPSRLPRDLATRAVVDGRYSAAAAEYKARIAAKPDVDAWVGLSLCRSRSSPSGALARRPEVVVGLYERLRAKRDVRTDPDHLSTWLDDDQVIIGSMSSESLPR